MAPHVIIVGGGFGGLSAAHSLRNAPVRVTMIDKRNYHLFRPMLNQVATGLLSDDEIAGPLRSILSHQKNTDVLLDEVIGISPNGRTVHLKHRDLAYDFLILATGIQNNYFGHEEWRQFAPGLKSLTCPKLGLQVQWRSSKESDHALAWNPLPSISEPERIILLSTFLRPMANSLPRTLERDGRMPG